MALNHYFADQWTTNNTNEQRLIEGLIIESIQITGIEVYYLPRTFVKVDQLFGEDILSKFEFAIPIEVYFKNITGFGGDKEFISKFTGLEIRDRASFIVARLRWEQAIQRKGIANLTRPSEGDLLFMPKTNSLFEIKFTKLEDPFYQLGKLYVYEMECEAFAYSSEKIETGITDIDVVVDLNSLSDADHILYCEDGTAFLLEDGSGLYLEEYTLDQALPGADNEFIRIASETAIDWTETNPFGTVED